MLSVYLVFSSLYFMYGKGIACDGDTYMHWHGVRTAALIPAEKQYIHFPFQPLTRSLFSLE